MQRFLSLNDRAPGLEGTLGRPVSFLFLFCLAPETYDHNVLQLFLQYFMDIVPRQI